MSGGVGDRLGRSRRDRLAYLTMLRRSGPYNLRSTGVRSVMLLVLLGLSATSRQWHLALLLSLPALAAAAVQLLQAYREQTGSQSRLRLVLALRRNSRRTHGRHAIAWQTHAEIVGGLLLVVVASWVVTDAPPAARLAVLVAAAVHFASTSLAVFTDQAWYNPAEAGRPLWHEVVRWLAAPVTAGLVAAIALPASWPDSLEPAVVVVCVGLLLVQLRIADNDLTVTHVAQLIREEGHAGRELVISETHGALSTHLRLLEQEARAVRSSAPALYELAVTANARLRETLTLARLDQESPGHPTGLRAPVETLARAVGAKVSVDIGVDRLATTDHDLARVVLSDLVGNAVNAGAGRIGVRMRHAAEGLVIEVEDDAPPMPDAVWKSPGTSSARLEARLDALDGSLSSAGGPGGKTVRAQWTPQLDDETEDGRGADDGQGAAGRRRAG